MNEKANILLVDDQPAKLLTYELMLAKLGENLIKADSAREALELLLKHDVAVVLTDVSMPEMSGFEMADIIRQHPRFQKTAIIFVSAVHLTDQDRLRGYEHGAVDYVSVPIVPAVLCAKVRIFIELHRKTRELERLNQELESRVEERTAELQESEVQFRTLANSIPQLAWMAHPDGSRFWFNQRWYDYTGTSLEEMQGEGWRKVHHPEHVGRLDEGSQDCWSAGKEWEDTFPIRGKDGRYRWFLTRAVPVCDSHGTVVRWLGTSTDISRHMAAEEQIRNLNRELKQRITELETIMQVLPFGVLVAHDPQCKLVTGNAAFSRLLSGNVTDHLSRSNADQANQPSFEVYRDGRLLKPEELPLRQAAAGSPVASTELELRRADGKRAHILVSANPLLDESGEPRGAVEAYFDITSRKRLERSLRQKADLLELASEAILVRNMEGAIQFWNAGAESLYGWRRGEAIGKTVEEILQTRFPVPGEDVRAALEQDGRWSGTLVQLTKSGSEVTVASRQALVRESNGMSNVVLEINRDITAQLQVEEALRSAEQFAAMGRVAGTIAHEINNPLEAIVNALFLLYNQPSLDDQARRYASIANQELSRLAHIARQTLGFYRESHQAVSVSLPALLDEVMELQSSLLRLNRISLRKKYRTEKTILGFPAELKQVLLNLIGNAIQAMPEGGCLSISVCEGMEPRMQRKGIRVFISDTGSGIKAEDLERIFEPFFTTKAEKGTGLGLWISKGILQKYGGTIRGRTLHLSGGCVTCFSVFLPGPHHSNGIEDPGYAKAV